MTTLNPTIPVDSEHLKTISIFELIPEEVLKWINDLSGEERRYILSLCHLICTVPLDKQAEFLDNYTADSLVLKLLQEQAPKDWVTRSFKKLHIKQKLTNIVLKGYIKQYYIHSTQDLRTKPDRDIEYLESVLHLINDPEERNNLFHYILGSEIIKMLFQMSWLQHERFYRLQKNQEYFINHYIKPIQHTHRLNGLVVPKDETLFFAKRDYFIKKPDIRDKQLTELLMSTFTTAQVSNLGFFISHNLDFVMFDYDSIFTSEPECIFLC